MAWTQHGHHIEGSPIDEENKPDARARCGGPSHCPGCALDSSRYFGQTPGLVARPGKYPNMYSSPDEGVNYPDLAMRTIVAYYNHRLGMDELSNVRTPITKDDVYVVWFSKTLQNWKALVSTKVADGMYYELTYNGNTDEIFVDAYKKTNNVVFKPGLIPDA